MNTKKVIVNEEIEMVIYMVEGLNVFIALIFLLIAIAFIFDARVIVKSKFKSSNENTAVNILKFVGYVMGALSLIAIYYLR